MSLAREMAFSGQSATADIEEGQEILADYGDFYWDSYRKHQYQELGISPKKENPISMNQKQNKSSFGKGFKKGFFYVYRFPLLICFFFTHPAACDLRI